VGHGAASRRSRHARFCRIACAAGFVVLALDFRGHGDSEGRLDGPLEQDVLAAVAWLRARPEVDAERICYRGSSLGGYYGLQAAPAARFAALALLCPAGEAAMLSALEQGFDQAALAEIGLSLRPDVEKMRAYYQANDVDATATRITAPTLLVHARGDVVVPLQHSLTLAARLPGRTDLVLLPGGDHSTASASEEVHRLVADWLWQRCV